MQTPGHANRLTVGIVVALTVHILVFYGVVLPALQPRTHDVPVRSVTLDVDLSPQQVTAEEPPRSTAEASLLDTNDPQPLERETEFSEVPERILPVTRVTIPTRQALNLTRPTHWTNFDEFQATPSVLSAMRPAFAQELAAARAGQQRQTLLQSRGIAREGLSMAAYDAIEGSTSNHLKSEAGCFSLLPSTAGDAIAPTGLENRWWRTACKGTYQSPFDQVALEYDASGRVIGQAAGR